MKTDKEPVDLARNPRITLEEAMLDSRCNGVLETMKRLGLTAMTRLQLIEYMMWSNGLSRWDIEYEASWIPYPLSPMLNGQGDYYVPSYLKGKLPKNIDPFFVYDDEEVE